MTLPLAALLQGAVAGGPTGQNYVDDVFSTYLYTGNGSTQTITNGIDLAGKGGLVWTKKRSGAYSHYLYDTSRGVNVSLNSDDTSANDSGANELTAFNATGFDLGTSANVNGNTATYVSWTFRKAPKFFDVQTATLASGNATVSFTDLATLGMVIVKRTDSTGSWYVWHRSLTAGNLLYLEQTAAEATLGHITVSGTTLTLVDGVLADGDYVCYGFAHDTSADGIIQCGSFTTDGSGNATVNLGWEPQYYLSKVINTPQNWYVFDSARGLNVSVSAQLMPNTSAAEYAGDTLRDNPTATGMKFVGGNPSETRVYLAIRRPNKPPTSGTQVYNAIARTGTGAAATVTGVGFAPDLVIGKPRDAVNPSAFYDRLRGAAKSLQSTNTNSEATYANSVTAFNMDGVSLGVDTTEYSFNWAGHPIINHFFRRAPGVFDVVCGDSGNATVARTHSLGVKPELIIAKYRDISSQWDVYCDRLNGGVNQEDYYLELNGIWAQMSSTDVWGAAGPSASYFYKLVVASYKAVFYLFATKAGISKVGSYTGNGSNQTINCGFTTGARFILIKRTDSTGDWFVWDSVRGIIAGNDPHLSINTTAAEVTTDDSIDPDTSGFVVNQDAATNINVNAATYIYLSFA